MQMTVTNQIHIKHCGLMGVSMRRRFFFWSFVVNILFGGSAIIVVIGPFLILFAYSNRYACNKCHTFDIDSNWKRRTKVVCTLTFTTQFLRQRSSIWYGIGVVSFVLPFMDFKTLTFCAYIFDGRHIFYANDQ